MLVRQKLEVYAKRNGVIKPGWTVDENVQPCTAAGRVLQNVIAKSDGMLPLGGAGEETSATRGMDSQCFARYLKPFSPVV